MIGSIFLEDWWLEAVTGGSYNIASVSKGGREKAKMAYTLRDSKGLRIVAMPPLTQFVGPWLENNSEKYAKELSHQKDHIEGLLKELPAHDAISLNLDPSLMNGLPFYWHGCDISVGYTYVLEKGRQASDVWDGFLPKIRTDIKKASREVTVKERDDVSILLDQIDKTFQRQNKKRAYSSETVIRLDKALRERSQCLLLVAEDDQQRVHAAAYFVWNKDAMHYLLGGADPKLRNSGAASLLLWHGIQASINKDLFFNFEGSMVEGVERFFRAFGARQIPYLKISRENRKAVFRRLVKEAFKLMIGSGRR